MVSTSSFITMAFIKIFNRPDGLEISYWKISNVNNIFNGNKSNVILTGYVDEMIRRKDGGMPVEGARKTYELTEDLFNADATRKDIYAVLKTFEDWKDAQDC